MSDDISGSGRRFRASGSDDREAGSQEQAWFGPETSSPNGYRASDGPFFAEGVLPTGQTSPCDERAVPDEQSASEGELKRRQKPVHDEARSGGGTSSGGTSLGDGTSPGGGMSPGDDTSPGDGTSPGGGTSPGEPAPASARRVALRAVDDEEIAPVIPLFGRETGVRRRTASIEGSTRQERGMSDPASSDSVRRRDAPGRPSSTEAGATWRGADRPHGGRFARIDRFDGVSGDPDRPEPDAEEVRRRAEEVLLRKLRARSLSLAEARTALRGVDGVDDGIVTAIIDRFVDLGYLDDASLAEQLTMSATEKRGQGRRAVAETLRKRGVARDVADAAIAEMPDDDAERALEFARSKIRSVSGKDYDADLRRLAGQLARRGYPSSVALTAARTALDEAGRGRSRAPFRAAPSSGVRFTPDD